MSFLIDDFLYYSMMENLKINYKVEIKLSYSNSSSNFIGFVVIMHESQ